MRKLLLITTALVGFAAAPMPARAEPVSAAAAAISSWYVSGMAAIGVSAAVATSFAQIAGSVLLSAVSQALSGKGAVSQSDIRQELQQPTSLPVYRYVYGRCWATGTPAPVRVNGNELYACYILNSRPSEGPFTVYLDKREVKFTGDPFDFSAAGGAYASEYPFENHCQFWIGRGDQTAPPARVLAEAANHYKATDGWQGRTVLWLRLAIGSSKVRSERWPATPPEVMVDGKWSRVWDPRDPAQDPDDTSTWTWSANHALCTLDALRQNPLRAFGLNHLRIDTFTWAADVADEAFQVKSGSTIPQFEANGTLAFAAGSEIEDQVQPLADAGAATFTRVGGQLGLVPATWRDPAMVLRDVLSDQPLAFQRWRPSSELVTAVTASYTSPERAYEDAATPVFALPGAQAEDGGEEKLGQYDLPFVIDYRQAQHVAYIMGMRTRMQRSVTAAFPPEAFNLVGGSVVTLDLPAPYAGRNGTYLVEEASPGVDLVGTDGVAMRVALSLREITPAVFAWDPETMEQEISFEDFDPTISGVFPPGAIAVLSDASTTLISGDTSLARIRFAFEPSISSSATSYEWQFRQGADDWQSGGLIDADVRDGSDQVFGFLSGIQIGQAYTIRVRALTPIAGSVWVESASVTASAGSYLAAPPTWVSAIGGAGEIAVTARAPNSGDYRALEIWGADVDNSGASVLLFGPVYGSANATVTEIETGLGATVTRFYFARSVDRNGSASPFSASISATTT